MKGLIVALCLACAVIAAAAEPADVEVRSSVDRTALWVGDRVTYTIVLTCRRGIDVLPDDLSRDKLQLEGLDAMSSESERSANADGTTRYRFRYYLTTYRVDVPSLKIAPLTIRYYVRRAGQRLEDAAPAGGVQAPGAVLAFRSVLPDDPEVYAFRDDRGAAPRSRLYAALPLASVALILVSVVPAALFVVSIAGRAWRRRMQRSLRHVRQREYASLESVRSIDLSDDENRHEAYGHVNALVREHLQNVFGIPALALTPGEIESMLASRGTRVPGELVTSVLSSCDVARYAPPDALPSADACRQAIEQSGEILATRR